MNDKPKPVDLGTPTVPRRDCKHFNFRAQCNIIRLEDSGQFLMEITAGCCDCGTRFQFMGLNPGLNLQGAMMSPDALEARLAICPEGSAPSPLDNIVVSMGHPRGLS